MIAPILSKPILSAWLARGAGRARRGIAALVVAVALLLPPSAVAAAAVTVKGDVVNLRGGPGTSYPVVGQVTRGTKLETIATRDGWHQVRTPDGKTAWIAAFLTSAEATPADGLTVVWPTEDGINLRAGPGTGHAVVGKARAGQRYVLIETQDDWRKVRLPGGGEAWIASWLSAAKDVSPNDFAVQDIVQEVVATAAKVNLRSQPYLDFEAIDSVSAGARMRVLAGREGFFKVRTAEGQVGWVYGTQVKLYNVTEFDRSVDYDVSGKAWEISQLPLGEMTQVGVNLRSGPGTNYRSQGQLPAAQRVKVGEREGAWAEVGLPDGRRGWVHSDFVQIQARPAVAEVRVEETTPQTKVLSIRGVLGSGGILQEFEDGRRLAVYLGVGANPAALQVNARELNALTLNDAGVMLSFNERPRYRVLENTPSTIRIELSATVDKMALEQAPDRERLVLDTSGFVAPQVAFDAGANRVRVTLPRTTYKGPAATIAGKIVRSVQMRQTPAGLVLDVDSAAGGRFHLRRTQNQVVVEFLSAGLAGKTIVIDPGHGGKDPGARGATGLTEKEVNLKIGLKLKPLLEQAGAKVIVTRTSDQEVVPQSRLSGVQGYERQLLDLEARVAVANQSRPDLFLAIHNNSDPGRRRSGTSTFYSNDNLNVDRSRAFSEAIQAALLSGLGRKDERVRAEDFYVVRHTQAPAALAEVMYVSDATEEKLLADDSYQVRIAQALFRGIERYFR